MPEIAITGMGGICSLGNNLAEFMPNLEQKATPTDTLHIFAESIKKIKGGLTCNSGQSIVPLPIFAVRPSPIFPKHKFTPADTLNLARIAAQEAFSRAGLSWNSPPPNTGVAIGTTVGASLYFLESYNEAKKELPLSEHGKAEIDDYLLGNPAMMLARELKINGPVTTVTNACTSGADSIAMACRWLELGLCDYAVAGGADALSYISYVGFSRLMLYDSELCRPFSRLRNGLTLGEGAGAVVLERATQAEKRGARIFGFISGYGSFNDAHHLSCPHPDGRGLQKSIKAALNAGGIGEDKLAFVNAHGTGTIENDKAEHAVFNNLLPNIPIWALKGHTGHTLGASGSLEIIFCLLALMQNMVPCCSNYTKEEKLEEHLITKNTEINKLYALSTSLGFAGSNTALLIKKADGGYFE